MTSLFSCGVDRWPEYYKWTGRDLWIDSVMREEYLWFEDIPNTKDLNYFLEPDAFLKKIISPLDKGYSSVDTLYATPLPSYGFDYTLYSIVGNDTAFNALITYVIPGSPAAEVGLKRGEWIMKVNDDFITKKTEELLKEGESRKLLMGEYSAQENEAGETEGVITSYGEANLPASRPVEDVTIPAYDVLTGGVGYLAYNSFSAEDNSELLRLSQYYKENNVKEFVLDLRYNAGGAMDCVQLLATILAPADKLGSTLASLEYSQKQMSKDRELTFDNQLLQGGNNLNLSKVYILTSSTTAGAAEMLINCLKPYMTVVLVGATTKGENVATASFSSDKFQWILRPVVCEVFNSEGKADYSTGFTADYAVNSLQDFAKVLPLGNPNEEMLSAALGIIDGSIVLPEPEPEPEPETQMKAVKSVKVKRTFRNGLIVK
ncbi:S41 family peptidase [Bacteroides intestinalis]|jgi:C-terminal processing protease CtpA/Prc